MEFRAADPIVLTNASVVAADRVFVGWVAVDDGRIVEIGEGRGAMDGIDCQGDFLLPGLVELHTDHLEAHFMPRPRVFWHAGSAVMAYDAQIAAAGITTVFDSFRVGMDEFEARGGVGEQMVLPRRSDRARARRRAVARRPSDASALRDPLAQRRRIPRGLPRPPPGAARSR